MSNKAKITTPKSDGKSALVPKLRFPEFLEAEGWNTTPGDELFEQINNRQAPVGLPILAITQEHGAIPRDLIDYHVSVTDKSVETYKEVRPGDFIISLRSFQGGIEYSDYHGICSPAYVILRKRAELTDLFFKQHFKSHSFIQQLTKNLEGLRDGKMVSYKQFSELLLLNPSPPEQQKIADCLSSVDELIAAQAQKLDALKTHKKGLMQQLFPQEGETQPRLRFPEFQNAGEWVYMELDSFLLGHSERVSSNTDFPIYSSTRTGLKSQKDYFNDRELDNDGEYGVVPEGYFVYRHMSDDGSFKFNINKTGGKIAVSKEYPVFTTVDLHSEFLLHLLNNGDGFREFALAQKKGGTRTRLYLKVLRTWKALLPTYSEQRRIASCLSSLDALITAETQKLEALKTHRKGLMQQLFPSRDEVEA